MKKNITTLSIYPDTKDLVIKVKENYRYKTIDDCLNEVLTFIDRNKINPTQPFREETPTEVYRNDIRMYFDDLRKFQRDDSQSLRKFLGALEKTYLKPLINKLEIKDILQAVDLSKSNPVEPAPNLDDLLPKNTPAVSAENLAEIDRLKVRISELNRANKEALDNADNCKNVLKEFVSKIKIVRSIVSGNEICEIDMKKDEFMKLKERAGVI
ncbi:hypothetical protein [Capnocytophaga ochracea]|jgi:hypothetical protein|uniref:hypothetical protein n=2 Tax=Capnocytophaga TaxID=1016 RepID=UPI002B4A5D17|nr:hypothetical protein [Capnocytophaga ochracea]MEB3037468.1 hypothetical protein [Capnocytophaga ochracea]